MKNWLACLQGRLTLLCDFRGISVHSVELNLVILEAASQNKQRVCPFCSDTVYSSHSLKEMIEITQSRAKRIKKAFFYGIER